MRTSYFVSRLTRSVSDCARFACILVALAIATSATAMAQQSQRPNILVIMGDDIGYWNLSYNNGGMLGYRTSGIGPGRALDSRPCRTASIETITT